jgi:hypothetical protein
VGIISGPALGRRRRRLIVLLAAVPKPAYGGRHRSRRIVHIELRRALYWASPAVNRETC